MSIDLYFGVGALIAGIYCVYQAYVMKTKGIICATLLLDKETAKKKCKNIGEFLAMVIMPTFILGIIILLYGAVTLVDLYVVACGVWLYIVMGVTLAALIWFAMITGKAKKLYY